MFWTVIVLFLPACVYGIGQPHYECGEHGRFEYCIDGIPGCIVGCHCHPGYYFDTESKICEPNAKLVHEYRRLFSGVEPTRVPDLFHDQSNYLYANASTVNPIEAHVDNIAKESDDLGDWLYNQFFKTIESQVINNTDDTAASTKPPTRRSGIGGSNPSKKPKRKKKKGKNTENKKKGDLRRKLLRITEDDSLFDDSGSGSSGGSGSYSGSSSADSSSGTSASHEKDDTKDKEKDDKEHGHRKILMFNKKPKPPLPSFIFMPHAFHTPFFPPIGLPAPPVPMYPMVPVPPMPIQPIFSLPVAKNCSDKDGKTSQVPSGSKPTSPTPPTSPAKQPTSAASIATPAPNKTTATTEAGVNNKPPASENNPPANNSTSSSNLLRSFLRSGKHGQQKKILRQIQEHMKFPRKSVSKKIRMKPRDNLPDIDTDYESPLLDSAFPIPQDQPVVREPPPEDVDFKYLAQLIHKMDNKGHSPKKDTNSETSQSQRKQANLMNDLFSIPAAEEPTRRNFNNRRFLEAPDETYYSKLGHQIATLIRKLDGGDHRDNVEPSPSQPVFSENSHAPRSYWERSVRSLLKRFSPSADEYYGQKNYEENLFNLESKIETIASTVTPLSLNELENVIFLIDKSKSRLQSQPIVNNISATTTKGYEDDNLNINLLPRNYNPKAQQKLFEFLTGATGTVLGDTVKNKTRAVSRYETAVYNSNNIHNFIPPNLKNSQNQLRGVLMHNFRNAPNVNYRNINQNQLNSLQRKNMTYYYNNRNLNIANIANLQKMFDAKLKSEAANSRNRLPRVPWLAPKIASLIENQKNSMLPEQLLSHQLLTQQLLPQPQPVNLKFQNHPKTKNNFNPRYYVDNSRHSHHKGVPVPIRVQIKPSHLKVAPSYFHHELQHFDFFDK